MGVGWQLQRCEQTGRAPRRFVARRMLLLFLFGCLHVSFLWVGDILTALALTALIGLIFARRKTRSLWIAGAVIYLIGAAGFAGIGVFYIYFVQLADQNPEYYEESLRYFGELLKTYRHGTWAEIAALRMQSILEMYAKLSFFMVPFLLSFFLWGMAAARRVSPGALKEKLQSRFGPGALVGFLLTGILFNTGSALVWLFGLGLPAGPTPARFLTLFFYELGTPLLTLAYLIGLALWWSQSARSGFLRNGLAATGRTALSNYLLQSIIATTLVYGYGFGLYGRLGIACVPLLAVGIFTLQMILSRYWLTRFRYGPAEWLWRYLTYRGRV